MASSASSHSSSLVNFRSVSCGPKLAFHTGCVINGCLYVHGGIDKKGSTKPLCNLYRLNIESGVWETLSCSKSPSLSHHASVASQDRYFILIGGWDGKARTSDVFIYDTKDNRWLFPKCSGFHVGAGLSSHTATLLANGDVLVIGREGSLRMQRRSGNAFRLRGDVSTGVFKYTEYPLAVSSRSGHASHIIGSSLYIYGGRSDKAIEFHGGYKTGTTATCVDKLLTKFPDVKQMPKPPCSRKHHVAVAGSSSMFIHGGETFDGRSREPVGEMYLLKVKPHIQWYSLGVAGFGRAGHVCGTHGNRIIIHGGEGGKNTVFGDTVKPLGKGCQIKGQSI